MMDVPTEAMAQALDILGFREDHGTGDHTVFVDAKGRKTNAVMIKRGTSLAAVSLAGKDLERQGVMSRRDFVHLVKGLAGKLPHNKITDNEPWDS